MMDTLVEKCKINKIKTIYGYYYPTVKNKMVKEFYEQFGFKKIEEDSDGNAKWMCKVEDYKSSNNVIEVK